MVPPTACSCTGEPLHLRRARQRQGRHNERRATAVRSLLPPTSSWKCRHHRGRAHKISTTSFSTQELVQVTPTTNRCSPSMNDIAASPPLPYLTTRRALRGAQLVGIPTIPNNLLPRYSLSPRTRRHHRGSRGRHPPPPHPPNIFVRRTRPRKLAITMRAASQAFHGPVTFYLQFAPSPKT